jgi:hypothetical protein
MKRLSGLDWDINTHRPEQLKQLRSVSDDTSQLHSVRLGRRHEQPHTTATTEKPSSSLLSSSTPFNSRKTKLQQKKRKTGKKKKHSHKGVEAEAGGSKQCGKR